MILGMKLAASVAVHLEVDMDCQQSMERINVTSVVAGAICVAQLILKLLENAG